MKYAVAPLQHRGLVTVTSIDAVPPHRLVARPLGGRIIVFRRTAHAMVRVGTFAHISDAAAAMSRWI